MKKNRLLLMAIILLMCEVVGDAAIRNPFIPQIPEEPIIKITEPPPKVRPTPRKDPIDMTKKRTQRIVPEETKETEVPEFEISGIVWNSDRPQVIINGEVIDVGSTIADAKIIDINKNGIKFTFEGKQFEVNYK